MKREKLVSVLITEDEKEELMKKVAEKMAETGKLVTISSYIRAFCIRPVLNGNSSPPQETEIEEPPNETEKNLWDDISF